MGRIAILAYGALAYLVFFGTFNYAILFIEGFLVPKDINDGVEGTLWVSVLINASMLGLFAIQHAIMARPGFKRAWTKIIPPAAERSTFVLIASLILALTMWQWRPIPAVIWDIQIPLLRTAMFAISLLGFGIVLYSSFLIDHFDLFGLRQVFLNLRRREYHEHPFMERSLYRAVRHPLMLGFMIAFWVAPTMTAGHLLFAILTTAYIFVGTHLEERDLIRYLGQAYLDYRERTPMFFPIPKIGKRSAKPVSTGEHTAGA
jgi:protein-S-isoprenylcysteine O-methyltransferase Ste14